MKYMDNESIKSLVFLVVGSILNSLGIVVVSVISSLEKKREREFNLKKEHFQLIVAKSEELIEKLFLWEDKLSEIEINLKNNMFISNFEIDKGFMKDKNMLASYIYTYFPEVEKKYVEYGESVSSVLENTIKIFKNTQEAKNKKIAKNEMNELIKLKEYHENSKGKLINSIQDCIKEYKIGITF